MSSTSDVNAWRRSSYVDEIDIAFTGSQIQLSTFTVDRDAPNSQFHESESERLLQFTNAKSTLPAFDKAYGTRNVCIVGLALSWAISLVCLVLSPWTFRTGEIYLDQSGGYTHDGQGERILFLGTREQELVKLVLNICIALLTDCLGYIHACSLRWALWREKQLVYNSNLRLLASTRHNSLSRWSTNIVSSFLLMMCYASSSQLFLSGNTAQEDNFVLNGIVIAALGIGMLGQCAISSLCLWNSTTHILSWSSNPLNTTLICVHFGLQRRLNRCMQSAFDLKTNPFPTAPLPRQWSARSTRPALRYITRFLWLWATVFLLWAIVMVVISSKRDRAHLSTIVEFYGAGVPALQFNISALLITMSIQVWLTLGLHCTELLVNVFRDEELWRRATTATGTKSNYGPLSSIKAAASSWASMFLFLLKPLTHWLFGLSVNEKGGVMFMNWEGIFFLSLAIFLLPFFATYCSLIRPKGLQPSTHGNLQVLADLIDDWGTEEDTLWWGDKGISEQSTRTARVRHAGTTTHRLPTPKLGALYQG